MKKLTKIFCLGFVLIALALTASGCNTVEGMGEDIEAGGDNIEDMAD